MREFNMFYFNNAYRYAWTLSDNDLIEIGLTDDEITKIRSNELSERISIKGGF